MADTLLSEQIYLSRDSIRELIGNEVKQYLELENVDLLKSSFLSFIIDTISTLTGNLLFYQLSTYREFFLTKAQLPESILNLSSFLGYNTKEATASTANVLMTIPFGFDDPTVQFTIPEGFKFKAGNIEFVTYYETSIEVTNNANVTIQVIEENKRFFLPKDESIESFSFVLPVTQTKILEQEFQIDGDIQQFQFITLDVPISGEVAELKVEIQEPGSSGTTQWTEFDSLFLMDPTDKGYVSRRTDAGRRLTFGNGLIGVQPTAGSTVFITVSTTEGADGNVISGSIKDGDRIYLTTLGGVTQIVDYEVVNASSAYGGEDEESLEEIRKNSIASIRSLERLVSESDYQDINVVVPDVPFAQNALPVLKRSDLQVNEIELFTALLFGTGTTEIENLVPTRNAAFTNIPITQDRLVRDELITIGEHQYYNIFEIDIDLHNTVGVYEYIIYAVEVLPALETSYTSDYDIYSDSLEVERAGATGIFKLHYKSTESDADQATCEMKIKSSGSVKTMTNDSTGGYFIYTFNPYTNVPSGDQTYEFTIYDPTSAAVALYSNKVTFRADLSTFMRSNIVIDGTSCTIYDVPVVEKDYYDSIDQKAFELQVLQALISSADLADRRMLTDFSNIKFTNTFGLLSTMLLNQATLSSVIDILPGAPPSGCTPGDRYIIQTCSEDLTYKDKIARCTDSTSFVYENATIDSIVYIENEGENYIFSSRGWIPLPLYEVPLVIDIEIFRDISFSGTLTSLQNTIRTTLVEEFADRFGTGAEIYRSEIIDIVQEIDGVSHCNLRSPETSIFFNFKLNELTEDQLLAYGPEYVYFTEDSITVRVV